MPIVGRQRCNLVLAAASDIPHTCWKLQAHPVKLSVWQSALNFEFGQLTKAQWRQLQKAYAIGQHRSSPHDPLRHYTLMDFMPPLMQALNTHQFHAEKAPLPQSLKGLLPASKGMPLEASIIANCWGTLYEILRTSRSVNRMPVTFMTGPEQMAEWLQQQTVSVMGRPESGDILLIHHQLGERTYLDHVALVIDEQIFFEKAGTGNDTPYRLIDRATLEQSWRPEVFTFEFRRLSPKPLLPPYKQFGLHGQSTTSRFPLLATVSRPLAENFSVVWFREQEALTHYYYQIQPIHLTEVARGRFMLSPANW
ncbi:hypothetical protein [Acaryochloris thomasi]|nr:hypothetical protein [Acaryochloris thomasi]